MKPLKGSVDCILEWLKKLSRHFSVELSEDQLEIFTHALRNCTTYQVAQGFERCLNECQFMPKLADFHQRMPEQRFPPENPGRFVQQKPLLDIVRPIAREISVRMTGKEYDELEDHKVIHEVFAEATRERFRRMGIVAKWLPSK